MEENPLYCSCNEIPVIAPAVSPQEAVVVKGKGDIVVTKSVVPGQSIYTVEYTQYSAPQILAEDNPVFEVGQSADFTWNVSIIQKNRPIISRELTPQTDPVTDLTAPFTLSVEDVESENSAYVEAFVLEVEDEENTIVTRSFGTNFFNKVFTGFSYKDGVSAGQGLLSGDIAAFAGTVASGIKSVYGGERSYTIPISGTGVYFYWLYEVGSEAINKLELSGLPFPFIVLPGTLDLVNPHDAEITASYVVVRSSNKYGASTIKIKMS